MGNGNKFLFGQQPVQWCIDNKDVHKEAP